MKFVSHLQGPFESFAMVHFWWALSLYNIIEFVCFVYRVVSIHFAPSLSKHSFIHPSSRKQSIPKQFTIQPLKNLMNVCKCSSLQFCLLLLYFLFIHFIEKLKSIKEVWHFSYSFLPQFFFLSQRQSDVFVLRRHILGHNNETANE